MADIYKSESETKLLKYFIILFSSLSAIVFIVFGSSYILDGNVIFGIFELIPGIILIINLYFLWIKNTIDRSAMVVVFFVMLVSIEVFINGGIENTGNLWVILVPMFPLLLLNFKDGLKWLLTYSAVIFTITILGMLEILSLKFTFLELRQTMIVYTLFSILIYYNEKVKYINRQSLIAHSKELRQKDTLLIQQSKMASMGEMIGNIAHQWRQPLNALSLTVQKIKMYHDEDMLSAQELDKAVAKSKKLIHKMSSTIDDFRNFFKVDKVKQKFVVNDAIDDTLELLEGSFKHNNIAVHKEYQSEKLELLGHKNEFEQVLLNIINNAKDALLQNHIKDAKIDIKLESNSQVIVINITDNAGGIPSEIIDKIFDPYFTTKEQGKGTGIGLYMSKMIIETNMNGKIEVQNSSDGASFTIKIPKESIDV